jgi:hypothetical protein
VIAISADAWVPCPFCSKKAAAEIAELEQKMRDAYDTMIVAQYNKFIRVCEGRIKVLGGLIIEEMSARIDGIHSYEFLDGGNFKMSIYAECPHCGAYWELKMQSKPTRRSAESPVTLVGKEDSI